MLQGKDSYGYPLLVIQNVQSFMFYSRIFSPLFLVLNAGEGKWFKTTAHSKSAGHKDQNDNISENQNMELWDGKNLRMVFFQPLFSIKLYFDLEF